MASRGSDHLAIPLPLKGHRDFVWYRVVVLKETFVSSRMRPEDEDRGREEVSQLGRVHGGLECDNEHLVGGPCRVLEDMLPLLEARTTDLRTTPGLLIRDEF